MIRSVDALSALRDRPRRLLSVLAHPDDEAYGCAGTLARHGAEAETAVAHLCLTDGEAYSVLRATGLDAEGVARLRRERLERVAALTGLDALIQPGLPDGALAREPLERLGALVGAAIDALEPQVVVGADPRGVNGHPDHIAAHWAVRRALEGRPPRRFAMIVYLADLAEAAKPRLIFPTPEAEVDVVVELGGEEVEAKEACLRVHEALVTLQEDGPADLLLRPAVERYDCLGEDHTPPLPNLLDDPGSDQILTPL